MSPSPARGADALIAALQQAGVRRIFTLSGNHIMPVYDAAFGAGMALLHTRHEAAAVHMADAWARLSGQVGVALVTGGPGHANAVSALYTAAMAESPVLLLSGHAPLGQAGMGAFQAMRQADIAAPLCKASWVSTGADALATDLARAWRIAASGRPGPVHLSLPSDALEGRCAATPTLAPQAFAVIPQALAASDAQALRERLQRARRPLVLTGPLTLTRSGRRRLAALEAALGVPVVGMESPRGTGDPALGAFAPMLAQADCVLLLGKPLDFTLKFGRAPAFDAGCTFLQVDPDAAELERTRRAVGARMETALLADTLAAIDALTDAGSGGAQHVAWRDDLQAAIAYRPSAWDQAQGTAGRLHPVQALRPLQALLDRHPDSVLVSDGGEIGQWAQACLTAPQRVINGVAGSIGAALPFAAAARLAQPGAPVIAVLGDGTFGFHSAEIDTAVRHGLPYVAVVGNDARWNAEYQIQRRDYGPERTIGCELLPTRYDAVCAAFGGHGELVTEPQALRPAAERALASGLPACLNVMIDGLPAPNILRDPSGAPGA
jgi:acetolactate synthase I/II/III large subunit